MPLTLRRAQARNPNARTEFVSGFRVRGRWPRPGMTKQSTWQQVAFTRLAVTQASEATPFFERLCAGMTQSVWRSLSVRHGRTCSGHLRLSELPRCKTWMPGIKSVDDVERWCVAAAPCPLVAGSIDSSPAQRRRNIIGRPPRGRSVTFNSGHATWPGMSAKSKLRTIVATTIDASWIAKAAPMQIRGPTPNGR